MIPDFKTYITESIWSDIQDRSMGKTVRKEDDINLLDVDEFIEYLKKSYKVLIHDRTIGFYIENHKCKISIPIEMNDYNETPNVGNRILSIIIDLEPGGEILIMPNMYVFRLYPRKIQKTFGDKYIINTLTHTLTPKDKIVNNSVIVDVIDKLLGMVENPILKKELIMRKLSESIWSDIQDRSMGKTVRKEDDISHLDYVEFFTYLTEHYKPKSKKDNEKIGGRTPITNTDIIEIFIPIESIDDRIKTLMIVISKKDSSIVSIATSQTLFDKYVNLERTLSNNYTLNPSNNSPRVYIKSNKKLTNNTIVNLIDIFLNIVDNPILEKIS